MTGSDPRRERQTRETVCSESFAVGRREFVEQVRVQLAVRGRHRAPTEAEGVYALKEPAVDYATHSTDEMARLSGDNTIVLAWNAVDQGFA